METLVPQIDPQKLKAARERAKITQEQMGEHLSLTKAQVSNFETGFSEMRSTYLSIWAKVCEAEISELMTEAPLGAFFKRDKTTV